MSRMQTAAAAAPDRRGFLGLLSALPALGALDTLTGKASAIEGDDRDLIMACQEAAALYDYADAIAAATDDDDAAAVLDRQYWAICKRIGAMRSTTFPAMQMLARLIVKTDGNVKDHGRRVFQPDLVNALVYSVASAGVGSADAGQDKHPECGGVA